MTIAYRPEIDGLRALAVSAVLLCHANFSYFAGGFVGVDVFFVISGFLITSLIAGDLKAGNFSFINFWERRIRRILPPLFFVFFAVLIAGWFLQLPADYKLLGQQVAAQSVFSSNVLFKSQAGYFDEASIVKPLLHTWSLSVEEQFYFFFPVAFVFLWRRKSEHVISYLLGVAFVSCAWAAIIVHNSPSSAFYLLPFRAWELLLGSLLALRAVPLALSARAREVMGWAGLGLILLSILFCTENTLFPWAAMPSCLGTALIIVSNQGGLTGVGKLLSLRPIVFVGLASYSLYLWHWPIISLVRYTEFLPFTAPVAAGCIGLSFFLALISWKFVETPVRRKTVLPSTRQVYAAAVISLCFFAAVGMEIHYSGGMPERLDPQVVRYAAGVEDTNPHRKECDKPRPERFEKNTLCQTNPENGQKPSFIVWGDSFADAMAPSFYDLSKKYGRNGYILTAHGCAPVLGARTHGNTSYDCAGYNERVLKFIEQHDIKNVIMIANWTAWVETKNDVSMELISATIDKLDKQGRQVYVMLDVPYVPFDPPRYLAFKKLYGRDELPEDFSAATYRSSRGRVILPLFAAINKSNLHIIDPYSSFCNKETCNPAQNGYSLYYNQGHLSKQGALYLNPLFEPYFRKKF